MSWSKTSELLLYPAKQTGALAGEGKQGENWKRKLGVREMTSGPGAEHRGRGDLGFQYLLLVRVEQCIDLPVHALRPLEGQCLRGLLGLFLGRKPQRRNHNLDSLF
jgi:hypothetical protein